jgi:hypothetical protein
LIALLEEFTIRQQYCQLLSKSLGNFLVVEPAIDDFKEFTECKPTSYSSEVHPSNDCRESDDELIAQLRSDLAQSLESNVLPVVGDEFSKRR